MASYNREFADRLADILRLTEEAKRISGEVFTALRGAVDNHLSKMGGVDASESMRALTFTAFGEASRHADEAQREIDAMKAIIASGVKAMSGVMEVDRRLADLHKLVRDYGGDTDVPIEEAEEVTETSAAPPAPSPAPSPRGRRPNAGRGEGSTRVGAPPDPAEVPAPPAPHPAPASPRLVVPAIPTVRSGDSAAPATDDDDEVEDLTARRS